MDIFTSNKLNILNRSLIIVILISFIYLELIAFIFNVLIIKF